MTTLLYINPIPRERAPRSRVLGRLILWAEVIDLVTLVVLIGILGSIDGEANPIVRWAYGYGGLLALAAMKLTVGFGGQATANVVLRLSDGSRLAVASLAAIVLVASLCALVNAVALVQVVSL